MKRPYFIFIFFILPSIAFADFINVIQADKCETIIEVFINNDNIIAKLEIGEQDYPWFSSIIPQEYVEGGYNNSNQKEHLEYFMRQQFILQSGNRTLIGKIKIVEPRFRKPGTSISAGKPDSTLRNKKIIYVEIEYPIPSKIGQVSFTPPMQKNLLSSPANVGFIVYHKTIPVNDLRFLVTKEKLNLDWEDPWYSYFENKNISRHHSSSFMSFLYVEPYEVRHEVLVRIKDLEGWIDFEYGMDDVIEVEEQDSLMQLIADLLVKHNILRIDGEARKPIIDRIHFVEVNLSGIQIMEIPKPLSYATAIIGIIFAYPDPGMPKEVTIHWDMFNEKIQNVPSMSIDPAGPWPYELQPSDSILKWTNFLKHYKLPTVTEQKTEPVLIHFPLFTVVCILMILFMLFRNHWSLNGLSKWRKFFFVFYILLGILAFPVGFNTTIPFVSKKSYSDPEAKKLISRLLKNTYRAFDFREEGDIYDKLSMCNDTELLQQIYLQTRKSMIIENQGGVEAKVDEVLITKVEKENTDEEGLAYRCNWIVKGFVGHWGHKHKRVNQYDAIIKIKPIDGVWKMYNLDIIEEVRL